MKPTFALLLCLGLAACAPKPRPDSIQHVMAKIVDPSADKVWEAVTSTLTADGVRDRQPRTDADWLEVRNHARQLIEGAKLLQTPRPVGSNAHSVLADADTPGTRTAVQIGQDIRANPAKFYQAAAVLQKSGEQALAAIDARDAQRLILAGESMDLACESCHASFWYPRNPFTPFPDATAFAKIAQQP